MKKVSIIIPCYNVEKYVSECLDSICKQTYENIEIICVDDGSTDNTQEIIKRYIEKDNRISLLQQKNQYAGIARNNGLKQAKGEYVCFLDSDDFFREDMIEKMLYSAEKEDADIVLCNAEFYDELTKEITEPFHMLNMDYLKNIGKVFSYKDIPERILSLAGSAPWNKFYKVDFLRKNNIYFQDIKRCNDVYFVGMSLVLAQKICYINERFVTYRVNNQTSLQGYSDDKVSYDFYTAFYALKEGLMRIGVYDDVKIDYVNKVLQGIRVALEKQRQVNNFLEMYNFIKTEASEQLGLLEVAEEEIYAELELYRSILKYDAVEYLFYKCKRMQMSNGEKYLFPYELVGGCKKVAIYAMGEVGNSFYRQLKNNRYYQLVACFDSNYLNRQKNGLSVESPVRVKEFEFDKIVVAIRDRCLYKEIENILMGYGVEKNKIVWGCS